MNARRVLGAIVLAGAAAALYVVVRPRSPVAESQPFASSAECQQCHAQAYAEWSRSWHARSWSDPEVRTLSNAFANADCIDCHAPRPVFETGLGERVLPRSARRAEGVDCIACHALPRGHASGARVAGTRDAPDAPCRPTALRELGSSEFCAVCHNQHQTFDQWKASDYASRGIGCVECHMTPRVGEGSTGRDHSMLGGHDIELVRRAVALRARREGGRWIVEVENVGAGHHFPTEERSRAGDVFWRPLGSGPQAWRHVHRFRSPYRAESLPDTLLPAHATKTIPIDDPDASGPIEVALFYSLKPYWADPAHPDPEHEARRVHTLELRP